MMLPKLSSFTAETWIWIYSGICFVLWLFASLHNRIARKRGLSLVDEWARSHQFTILKVCHPLIVPLWKTGRGFRWFYLTLQDASGEARQCWVRYGGFAAAPGSIEVIWDEKSSIRRS
jgi:hypothetical protein